MTERPVRLLEHGPAALTAGFRGAFDVSAGIALAGALVAGVLLAAPARRTVPEPEQVRVK